MTKPERRLDPWYVTGFIEGEGCFTYSRSGRRLALYFAIKLTGADRALLVTFQEFFGGAGRIYRVAPRAAPTPRSGFRKAAAYYRVCRHDELGRIISHFDAYPLRGVKAASYAVWREMVMLKREFRSPIRAPLDALAAKLSASSPRNAKWLADQAQSSSSGFGSEGPGESGVERKP